MAREVWEKVRAAEAEAAKIVEDAKLQSAAVVKKAREEAVHLINNAGNQAVEDGEKILAERLVEAQGFKEKRAAEIQKELQTLVELGEKKINGAVNLILEKVVR